MPSKSDKELVVALDIGTSKIVAIVGEVQDDGELEVIGFGSHPSRGLKKGVVVNIEICVNFCRFTPYCIKDSTNFLWILSNFGETVSRTRSKYSGESCTILSIKFWSFSINNLKHISLISSFGFI